MNKQEPSGGPGQHRSTMRCDLSQVVRFEQLSVRTETDNERASGCYRSRGFEDHGRVTETVEALAVEVQQFSLDLDQLQG